MTLDQIVAWLNRTYPGRDWNQDCQRLVWNVVWCVTGVDESQLNPPYPTATAARLASSIESLDASKAPAGAIHYFKNPAAGHVGVSLGGESILMTGTKAALGKGATYFDGNFGITTVSAYVASMNNPYLGWSRQNGRFPTLIGKIGGAAAESEIDVAKLITTDKGDILVVDHNAQTYWNVHEGIPSDLVPLRIQWLKDQGAVQELVGHQPAVLLAGYRHAGSASVKIDSVQAVTAADVEKIAARVNDMTAERMRG